MVPIISTTLMKSIMLPKSSTQRLTCSSLSRVLQLSITALATCLCIHTTQLSAQELDWQTNVEYTVDNAEYHNSGVASSRTYHLIMLRPTLGIKWHPHQSLYIGTHLRKNAGTPSFMDQIEPTIYYDYHGHDFQFRAGIFPRADVLPQYWTQFYNSSFRSYNAPQMYGAFAQLGEAKSSFINLWMDWRALQGDKQREEVIFGSAANYKHGRWFADYQAYLHQLGPSKSDERDDIYNTQSQLLLQSTVGLSLDHTPKGLKGFVAVGLLLSHEANHLVADQRATQVGFIGRLNLEYHGIGTRNLTYWGQPQQTLLEAVGSDLYLGSPFLRRPFYHRNDLYINLLQSKQGKLELSSIQHISGGKVYFQHTLSLKMQLDAQQFAKKGSRGHDQQIMPWLKLFK